MSTIDIIDAPASGIIITSEAIHVDSCPHERIVEVRWKWLISVGGGEYRRIHRFIPRREKYE